MVKTVILLLDSVTGGGGGGGQGWGRWEVYGRLLHNIKFILQQKSAKRP